MALNSSRGNPIGAAEGPDKTGEGAPPPVAPDVKETLLPRGEGGAADADVHAGGQDAGVATSAAERADPKVEMPPPPLPPRKSEERGKGGKGGKGG
ncbi:hypothetical protein F4809DRAFT_590445 [Biscogniauxia mediterranea]|nr:hypothetical protein F4809DRAFT_590445 [Biscogniauxia mediterranea]